MPSLLIIVSIACEVAALVGVIIFFLLVARRLPALPATIPTHVDFDGKPDDNGPKNSLWIVAGAATVIYLILTIAAVMIEMAPAEPEQPHLPMAGWLLFATVKTALIWLLYVNTRFLIEIAEGRRQTSSPWVNLASLLIIVGAMAGFIGFISNLR